MLRIRFLFSLVAFAFAVTSVHAALVWRPGEGWSDESAGGDSAVAATSSRDELDLAHKLEAAGKRDQALVAYKTLLRRWPISLFAPEAQFRMAKILEDEGSFDDAFKAFQKMVQKYPSSEFFDQALDEQYRIANLYLAGEPQRIWKIPVGPSMDKTIELYQRVIQNAPYGAYAPQCQFNIGLAYEKQRKYTDAIDAYQKVLDNYPQSTVACNAQYQIGYAWMHSSNSGDYDLDAAKKAVDAFQDYLVRYPSSDKAAQAQENIQKLSQKQTQGAFDIAQFYDKQHSPDGSGARAAFIYYNEVVREDPNSEQAQIAKKRIQELRTILQALPGGLGPDGTGSLAAAPKVASNPNSPEGPGPDPSPAPIPDPTSNTPLPADPDAPGATGTQPASLPLPGDAPAPPAPAPAPMPEPPAPASTPETTGPMPTPGGLPTPAPSTTTPTPAPTAPHEEGTPTRP